jgi:hypothetical protein
MKDKYITAADLSSIAPASLVLGVLFATIHPGGWAQSFIIFSFLFFLSLVFLRIAYHTSNSGRTLAVIISLAFFLRLVVGVTLHLALPLYGHEDEDDRAGYVFTDAHTRDDQAWKLATSNEPIIDAFSKKYSSDQYGGLLAFNAFVYRYLSPDAQRPLVLILFSAFFAALGVSFLWKSVAQVFGERVAWASAWIFALYPESVLLGASAMREPYLLTFSAFAMWGFVNFYGVQELVYSPGYAPASSGKPSDSKVNAFVWLGLGLLGMLLVSPVVALVTIVIFAGWIFFTRENRQISWKAITAIAVIFILGLFLLSSSLNRSGQFEATSPFHVINDWLKSAVKWDAYQLERGSGWVQKIFDEGPAWIRLPFVAIYGIFQPVLPATFIHPTKIIWAIIGFIRALGWYMLLPVLILSFVAATGSGHPERVEGSSKTRNLILWLSLVTWIWILLAALRGGGDLFDNPRYRTILFLWQAILAGYTWVWWRETRSVWFGRVLACEIVFLLVFTQWYASRYIKLGGQLQFAMMIALIVGLWGVILGIGWWQDKRRA